MPWIMDRIQSFPDKTITFMDGKKLVVKNTEADVISKAERFYRKLGLVGTFHKLGGLK